MKARLFLPILFFLAFFWFFQKRQKAETTETAELAPPVTSISKKPQPVAHPKKKSTSPTTKSQPPDPEDPQVVPFQVKEGLAVAFGDVILGTPEDEGIQQGYFRIPAPQYWDKPEIPYAIDPELPRPQRVREALQHISDKTGVKFIPYDTQPDAIVFQNGKEHCLSTLGRQGGLQPIRLAPDCARGEIVHEVLHSFGFIHEQSRSDRDEYVEVVWDNIEEPYRSQFNKLPDDFMGPANRSPFDYHSVMLYSPTLFGRVKGDITLKSRTSARLEPSRDGLSAEDIRRVKSYFNLD